MTRFLDLDTWNRKEHFEFFLNFEEPFFGVTVQMECTELYRTAKETQTSFYLTYLHKTLQAINSREEFRYRIDEEKRVVVYETIHASVTIPKEDGTFGFCLLPFIPDFGEFVTNSKLIIQKTKESGGTLFFNDRADTIHFTTLPWLNFTSMSHSRMFKYSESATKICFGKLVEKDGKRTMPLSIHAHHALVDGRHIGEFVSDLETLFAQ